MKQISWRKSWSRCCWAVTHMARGWLGWNVLKHLGIFSPKGQGSEKPLRLCPSEPPVGAAQGGNPSWFQLFSFPVPPYRGFVHHSDPARALVPGLWNFLMEKEQKWAPSWLWSPFSHPWAILRVIPAPAAIPHWPFKDSLLHGPSVPNVAQAILPSPENPTPGRALQMFI